MLIKDGTVAYGTTGLQATINCGFQPDEIEFFLSGWFGGGDNNDHISIGRYLAGATIPQHVDSTFNDSVNIESISDDTKVINHLEFDGTNIVSQVAGTVASTSATGFRLNMSAADVAYNIYFIARKY